MYNNLQSSHIQELFRNRSKNNASTPGNRYQPHNHITTFTCNLARSSVWSTNFVTPVAPTDWNDGKFGQHNGSSNCSSHFFGLLNTQVNMTIVVSHCDNNHK
ncbi:hypothetical protein NPIL_356691 [Nephila pilipes]|uniref:Uncharacterized protein n=1 Tax=Nephila pilipes TaxID=299642 RepID=A0A8X6TI84_NEPPI|nr:hypothetical protein NPIL_356691 [Nephila pilipes]